MTSKEVGRSRYFYMVLLDANLHEYSLRQTSSIWQRKHEMTPMCLMLLVQRGPKDTGAQGQQLGSVVDKLNQSSLG